MIKQEKDKTTELNSLNEKILKNDQNRLHDTMQWLTTELVVGHSKWLSQNDFRKLSTEMFNSNPEQRKMICSEWAARSIASVIDQLNRITSLDLQAAELVTEDREAKLLTNPIPDNEKITKIHPTRLVTLLQKASCIERVHTKLEEVIDVDNAEKSPVLNISELLPSKMLTILKESKTEEEFIDKANKNIKAYLKVLDIDFQEGQKQNAALSELYKQHTHKPEGALEYIKHALNKILEFVKILSKDSKSKEKIEMIIKSVNKGIEESKQAKMASSLDVNANHSISFQERLLNRDNRSQSVGQSQSI